jgi:hypothetical protein
LHLATARPPGHSTLPHFRQATTTPSCHLRLPPGACPSSARRGPLHRAPPSRSASGHCSTPIRLASGSTPARLQPLACSSAAPTHHATAGCMHQTTSAHPQQLGHPHVLKPVQSG